MKRHGVESLPPAPLVGLRQVPESSECVRDLRRLDLRRQQVVEQVEEDQVEVAGREDRLDTVEAVDLVEESDLAVAADLADRALEPEHLLVGQLGRTLDHAERVDPTASAADPLDHGLALVLERTGEDPEVAAELCSEHEVRSEGRLAHAGTPRDHGELARPEALGQHRVEVPELGRPEALLAPGAAVLQVLDDVLPGVLLAHELGRQGARAEHPGDLPGGRVDLDQVGVWVVHRRVETVERLAHVGPSLVPFKQSQMELEVRLRQSLEVAVEAAEVLERDRLAGELDDRVRLRFGALGREGLQGNQQGFVRLGLELLLP